jgi:hypothetical protein
MKTGQGISTWSSDVREAEVGNSQVGKLSSGNL